MHNADCIYTRVLESMLKDNSLTKTKTKILSLSIILCISFLWVFNFDFRALELSNLLARNTDIARYPYLFKVASVSDGVAIMYSPRSADASAIRSLRFMYPSLVYENDDSKKMVDAQMELARIQKKAASIVRNQPDIKKVEWELDKRWLSNHGVTFL